MRTLEACSGDGDAACGPDARPALRARRSRTILVGAIAFLALGGSAHAQGTCIFEPIDTTLRLLGDCVTSESIVVPDGFTLDGGGHTIAAVDPGGGVFRGAVVVNGGATASVVGATIVALVGGGCQTGAERLRGIRFEGASGVIRRNRVLSITRGVSACLEGNAIEVRNTHDGARAVTVHIEGNLVDAYQKTGIVVSGQVEAVIRDNVVGASLAQALVPANAVQADDGALATIEGNWIAGNSWPQASAAATGILLIGTAPGTVVRRNTVAGNADVGIYVLADGVTVAYNLVEEAGLDGFYDIGIGNYGRDNRFAGNVIRGYATSLHGATQEIGPAATALE